MSRKAYQVKAGLIKESVKSSGKVFSVVASVSTGVKLKNFEFATFGCKTCKCEFATNKNSEPFCVICSSTDVHEIKSTSQIENLAKIDESELAAINCRKCGTHSILSMATAHLFDTKIHCVECGTEIAYELDDEDDGSLDKSISDDMSETDELPNPDIVTDDVDVEDTDDGLADDEVDTKEVLESAEVNDNEQIVNADPVAETNVNTEVKTAPVSLPAVEIQDTPLVVNSQEQETKISDEGVSTGEVKIEETEFPLIQVTSGVIEISHFANKIIATRGGVQVAMLTKENAKENAGIFNSKVLLNAINHNIKQRGAETALADFNFELTKVKLPIPSIVESKVKEAITASAENFNSKLKDLNEDFQQCLSLASAGMNKNFFKNKQNILKASLVDNLKAAGMSNAEKLVARVFSQHGNEHYKTLLEIANSLMAKSIEARNELAETLGEVNEITDDLSFDDDEDSSDGLEARLENASIKNKKFVNTEVSNIFDTVAAVKRTYGKLF